MKVGDIVTVHDGSYSLYYGGDGEVCHTSGNDLRNRRFRVLLTGVTLPNDDPFICYNRLHEAPPNDLMLCEVKAPEHVLFTQSRFCKIVDRLVKATERAEVVIPFGTKTVVIRLQ